MADTASITTWLSQNVTNPAPYANIIQARLQDSPGNAGTSTYWETDIGYNTTGSAITVDGTTVPADGWAQLYQESRLELRFSELAKVKYLKMPLK